MYQFLQSRFWAVEGEYLNRMEPLVLHRLEKGLDLAPLMKGIEEKEILSGLSWDDSTGLKIFATESKKVAVISIIGTMTKYGGMCAYGMKNIGSMIMAANAADHISGTVLLFDTPGGSVDGLPELTHIIKNSPKPIVGFIDGMWCSAGIHAGAHADFIIANTHNYATIGSIGTLCMLIDRSEQLKKEGIKVLILRAEQSKDKALLNGVEPITEEALVPLRAELKTMTEQFISVVKEGRGNRLKASDEEVFTGKTGGKEQAIAWGLIDAEGTLEDAVQKVIELSQKGTESTSPLATNSNADMKILSFLGLGKEVEAKLSDEQRSMLESADTKLAELETTNTQKEEAIASLTGEKTSLQQQLSEKESALAQLQQTNQEQAAEIARLEKAGDTNTKPNKLGDQNGGESTPTAVVDEQAERYAKLGNARKSAKN